MKPNVAPLNHTLETLLGPASSVTSFSLFKAPFNTEISLSTLFSAVGSAINMSPETFFNFSLFWSANAQRDFFKLSLTNEVSDKDLFLLSDMLEIERKFSSWFPLTHDKFSFEKSLFCQQNNVFVKKETVACQKIIFTIGTKLCTMNLTGLLAFLIASTASS